ncbi:uncharacterized protein F5891DRAFT_1196091 [Suillus fuscotomentosus]|uniref:Uncharacterized protein n=1 Tax=Suillus fuscotomentosus TaxID=1912939 RepID=A0AAD4DW18_9AGAM|nr:uncharacterized protein F5891DRAFT_1196091 [Suillus fuscotomentosus]KAG1893658.1 hypothetical protein F5891DRAFT_1196091 [Suillus fuscotomentosus]
MVSQISINSFYVERYSSDFYQVPNTISLGALRMNIQQCIKQKFQREWYEDQVHSDPTSIILSSNTHGSTLLDNNATILGDLCGLMDHIHAIVPSQQLDSSNAPSQHVALTPDSMSSPDYNRTQELLLLICTLDQNLVEVRRAQEEDKRAQSAQDDELTTLKASMDAIIKNQQQVSEDMRVWNRDHADDIRQQKMIQQNLKDNQEHLSHLQEAHAHNEQVRIYSDQQIKILEDGRREDGIRIRTLENSLAVEGTRIKQLESSIENSKKQCEVQMKVIHEEAEVKLKDVEAKCKDVEAMNEAGKRLWEVEKKAWEVERSSMADQIEEVEDMTIATIGWVCGADTKLIDCILLWHLLDLTQAKLAKLVRLSAPPGTNRATQSILWRDALGTTHLDSATVQFMADAKGMDLAIQKSSAIQETGDLVAHPKPGAICQEAFIQSISRHNVTEERPGLLVMVKFVMIGTVRL